jgi:hypothetical protein
MAHLEVNALEHMGLALEASHPQMQVTDLEKGSAHEASAT